MQALRKTTKRNSIECLDCLNRTTCKYANSILMFEEQRNVEIDCWTRKRFNSTFYTGFHKPMFLSLYNAYLGSNINMHQWIHALDSKFDVIYEEDVILN